ncbi:hypothetical protein PR048_021455 [Dryococelus australis]|uniref:Uncharacterized protein n=1 Tax=Dryococelus australis TaxID=614101 RepID=A0ABQ9GY87_9NEOP|nr:hypothetical protein PR048_021455 [Dryococelus australis]
MEYYDRSRSYDRFDGLDNFFDFVDFLDYVDEQYDDEWESETEDYSLYETVEALQSSKIMIPRRIMRDATNPLESFSDEQFRRTFRFSKDTVVGEVFPLLNLQNPENERGLPVPPALQLLTALKFYGACGFQVSASSSLHM